jgi:uncharacterized protein YjiS (DUF1127 family)
MTHTLNSFWLKVTKLFNAISFTKAKTELRSHRIYRETYKSLNELSDKELWDIGINRGDIHDIAYESSYGVKAETNSNLKGWV